MQASWSIDVDPARSVVRITLRGFFTPADVIAFEADRDVAHARLRCPPNQHLTFTDVREMKIQPQDTVQAFQALLANKRAHSRKIAFLTASSLARMQLLRAAESRTARMFTDPVEAERWLFEDEPVNAAPPAFAAAR